jgi:two-component sensor histidine kinase
MTRPHLSRVIGFGALLLGQLAIVGVTLATEGVILGAALEAVEIVLLGAIVLAGRYRRVSGALRVETERTIVLRERARLAEQMHDGLGQQLALIALRASALQTAVPERERSAAEAIRLEAQIAVERLHQALDLLHASDPDPAEEIQQAFSRSRAAGGTITDRGFELLASLDPAVQSAVAAVVREALTNAIRHAPGTPITAGLRRDGKTATLTVQNPLPVSAAAGPPSSRVGAGLQEMRRRVESLGGDLVVAGEQDFSILATLPLRPRRIARAGAPHRRSAPLLLVRDLIAGAAAAFLLATACYTATSTGTVLEPAAFAGLRPGMSAERAARLLPPRQAVVRVARVAPPPTQWRCSQYSDGNAPFAIASFQVCIADGRIASVTDLRKQPWR